MMLKMMTMIDNDDGYEDVDDVDNDWASSGDNNEDGDFDVDAREGCDVVNVGGEDFDARDAYESDDYYFD